MPFNEFNDKTILIVGGAGFVGSNLSHEILNFKPKKLVIVDNLISADISNVPIRDDVEFIHGSIADDKVLQKLSIDINYVFHLACYHGNQSSIHDPVADHDNNTITTLKLFDVIKSFKNLKKVVYSAAGCAVAEKTFDDAESTKEDAPVSLFHDSPYSISKIIGEFYGNYYFQQHGLPFVKARFQNVYGPREILGAGSWRGTVHTVWRNVTPTFIYKSLQEEELPLEKGGIASRDFIFVDDIVNGLMRCAVLGEPGEIYNIASGDETTIKELALLINEISGNPTMIKVTPARDWDRSGKRFGDTTKSREKIGFVAQTNLRDGLVKTVSWTKENKVMIERTISRHNIFMSKFK